MIMLISSSLTFSQFALARLDHTLPLHFGGMVSTSNQFNLDLPSDSHPTPFDREFHLIDIETDKMVVWTVEIDIGRGEIVL